MKSPAVYIMASGRNGTLYIGLHLTVKRYGNTARARRGFTEDHDVKLLVWYEQHERWKAPFRAKSAMKKWLRKWKLDIIEKMNPQWNDLWPEIIGERPLSTIATVAAIPAPVAVPVPVPFLPTVVIPAPSVISRERESRPCPTRWFEKLRGGLNWIPACAE